MNHAVNDIGVTELGPAIIDLANAAAVVHSGVSSDKELRIIETHILEQIDRMYAAYDGREYKPGTEEFFDAIFSPAGGAGWVAEYIGYRSPEKASSVAVIQSKSTYSITPTDDAINALHHASIIMAGIVNYTGGMKNTAQSDAFSNIQAALKFYAEDTGDAVPPEFSSLTESVVTEILGYASATSDALTAANALGNVYKKSPVPPARDVIAAIKRFASAVSGLRELTPAILSDENTLKVISPACSKLYDSGDIVDGLLESFCAAVPAVLDNVNKVLPACGAAVSAVLSTVSPMDKAVAEINSSISPDTVESFMGHPITESAGDADGMSAVSQGSPAQRAIRAYMMLFSFIYFSNKAGLPGAADYEYLVSADNWKITASMVSDSAGLYLSFKEKPFSECSADEKNDPALRRIYNDDAVNEVTGMYSGSLSRHLYDEAIGVMQNKRENNGRPNQIQNFGWSIGAELETYIRNMKYKYTVDDGQTPYQFVLRYAAGNLNPDSKGFSDKVNHLLRSGRRLRIWYKQPKVGIETNSGILNDPSMQRFLAGHRNDYTVETDAARNAGRGARVFLKFSSELSLRNALDDLVHNGLIMPVKEVPLTEERFSEISGKDEGNIGSAIDNVTAEDLPVDDSAKDTPESISVIKENAGELLKQLRVIRGLLIKRYDDKTAPSDMGASSISGIVKYADSLLDSLGTIFGVDVKYAFNPVINAMCPTVESLNEMQGKIQFSDDTTLKTSFSYAYKILMKLVPEDRIADSGPMYEFYSATPEERMNKYIPSVNFGAYVKLLETARNMDTSHVNVRNSAAFLLSIANLFSTGHWNDDFASDVSNIESTPWFTKWISLPLYVSTDAETMSIARPDDFPDITLVPKNREGDADECMSAALRSSVSVFGEAAVLSKKIREGDADNVLVALLSHLISVHRKSAGRLIDVPDAAFALVNAIPRDAYLDISMEDRRSAAKKRHFKNTDVSDSRIREAKSYRNEDVLDSL